MPTSNTQIGQAALRAVASPARLEILAALADGPATTEELAQRLGRSRQSLYYHLGLLEKAGLVDVDEEGDGRTERRYGLRTEQLAIGARRTSSDDRGAAVKAIRAILRLTAREAAEALRDPEMRFSGAVRDMIGLRGKARLTTPQLQRINELIDELNAILRSNKDAPKDVPLYALTIVLTPAREAGEPVSPSSQET